MSAADKLADMLRGMQANIESVRHNVSAKRMGTMTEVDGTEGSVLIDGMDEDTPCKLMVNAVEGDRVSVEIVSNMARVTGNYTNPPTDDTVAEEAKAVAEATNQHFWTDSSGVHVTQETEDDFATNGGPNILVNSSGVLLRIASTWLSQFTSGAVAFYDGAGNSTSNLLASFGTTGVRQYVGGVLRSLLNSSGLSILDTDGTTSVANFAATTRIGKAASEHISVSSTALELLYGTTSHFKVWLESSKVKFRIGATSGLHLLYDASVAAIKLMSNTTELARFGVNSLLLHGGLLSIISDAGGGNSGTTISSGSANLWLQAAVVYVTGALSLTTPLGIGSGGTGQTGVTEVTTIATVVTAQTNASVSTVAFAQWGKVAQLNVIFTLKSEVSVPATGNISDVALVTIASAYRPLNNINWTDEGDIGLAGILSASNGVLTLKGARSRGAAYTLSTTATHYVRMTYLLP